MTINYEVKKYVECNLMDGTLGDYLVLQKLNDPEDMTILPIRDLNNCKTIGLFPATMESVIDNEEIYPAGITLHGSERMAPDHANPVDWIQYHLEFHYQDF